MQRCMPILELGEGTDVRGDVLLIGDEHRTAAQRLLPYVSETHARSGGRLALALGGESGAGKSELAVALAGLLEADGTPVVMLQQDDYFVYPPETNAAMRRRDLAHVGLQEVRLDLLDSHIGAFLAGAKKITKPLVVYQEDRITEESLNLKGTKVLIAEGTYTISLSSPQMRVHIERTYHDTKESRAIRGREAQDDHLEQVLAIEHEVISRLGGRADLVVTRDWHVLPVGVREQADGGSRSALK